MKKILLFLFSLFANVSYGQHFEWATRTSAVGNLGATDMKVDNNGNLYVTGSFINTVDFDPGPATMNLTSTSSRDIFIAKYDSTGNIIWLKQAGIISSGASGAGDDNEAYSIFIDASGYIYVSGYSADDALFGTDYYYPPSGDPHGFISKLDASGNFLWTRNISNSMGGGSSSCVNSVTVDQTGNIYGTGNFKSGWPAVSIDFDPGTSSFLMTSYGTGSSTYDMFLWKLDSAGNFIWAKKLGTNFDNKALGICSDSASNIYINGFTFGGSTDLDPGPATLSLPPGACIIKLNSAGNFLWAKATITDYSPGLNSFCIDSSANIYSCDNFGSLFSSGTSFVDLDPGPGTASFSSTGTPAYIQKIDSSGNYIWGKVIASDDYMTLADMTLDELGNLYLCGMFTGTIDLDPGPGTVQYTNSASNFDFFFLKLNSTGSLVWSQRFGADALDQSTRRIVVDAAKNIYLNGTFEGDIDLDPTGGTAIYTGGAYDNFIARYSQGLCDDLTLIVDSVYDFSCITTGFGWSHAENGVPPYNYEWNTVPSITDSSAIFTAPGIYQVSVTDNVSCQREVSILVNGMDYPSNYDLESHLIAGNFRPGFNTHIWIDGYNNGCDSISGTLSIILDPLVSYNSASPFPDIISGDTLKWNFSSLTYDSLHVMPSINVSTAMGAVIGDSLCFETLITPVIGDIDTTNNHKQYCFPVINGYDPNDKQVFPQGKCDNHLILFNQELTYTIRFQNTGNAEAVHIYVIDSLDSNLNLNTVRIVGNSHPVITEVLPGNVLKFRFDNIHLADSTSDETHSHGYVIFEVDPLPSLPSGTLLENTAYIYFDFNPAVVTNTVSNRVVDSIPHYHSMQDIHLTCGSDYIFPDGYSVTDVSANLDHTSFLSPVVYCDSSITTYITIDPLNLSVTQTGATLTAVPGYTYQWMDCSMHMFIPGETGQSYNVTTNGDYAVIVTNGSCSDTSACISMTSMGFAETQSADIKIYPNPVVKNLTITTGKDVPEKISIVNLSGRTVMNTKPISALTNLDVSGLQSGVYFVKVKTAATEETVKLVKQ